MRGHRFAAGVLLGYLALLAGAVRAQDNAADVQGKWERTEETDGVVQRHVKEHRDGKTSDAVFDEKGNVVVERTSQYEVRMIGPVKLFIFSKIEVTSGENKGQKTEGPFAYIYRVEGDSFYEAGGMLANATGEPKLLIWKRVKEAPRTRQLETFTVADYQADIDELERRLLDQSSYLTRLGFDYPKALADLRRSISTETELARFVHDVQKLVMRIGDCHAGVQSGVALPATGFLPVCPADTASGLAALKINQNQLLDPECPYLESIDDEPLERWLSAAARYVAQGSPQLIRRRSLEWLGQVGLLREELNLPASETVTIGLRSGDGDKRTTQRLRLTNQGYGVAQVRLRPSRLLDGNIGYVLIPAMDDRLVEPTVAQIQSFRDTKGLIIDVRNNGGGTYGVMRALYGFFVPDDGGPRVTNIAAYRSSTSFAKNHIEYRPTYRADWDGWNDAERAAIRQAMAAFQPEWLPPAGQFSDWHYTILSRERNGRGGPSQATPAGIPSKDYFFYSKPVVVLSNAGSFSAADGFLNAFADLPQVTIAGEPSSGGSGATRAFQLPKTRLTIALSSMASFRPNGKLFDGNGIEVDVAVKPTVEDYTTGADSVIARGIDIINEKSR